MIGRVAAFIYGIASYLVFLCSIIYAVFFIGNYLVPKSIDVGPESGLAQSILIDIVLLGMFALQHSIMARPAFRRWWTRIIPASCERSTYVLISSLLLILIFWQWRPIVTTIWVVEGWPAAMLTVISWIGWLTALTSTYMIDHFELFGLRQVFDALRGAAARVLPFKTPLLYRLVRHPLMLGFLLVFWATPHHDRRASALRGHDHGIHPRRRPARGTRSGCAVRCQLRAVSPPRPDAGATPSRRLPAGRPAESGMRYASAAGTLRQIAEGEVRAVLGSA